MKGTRNRSKKSAIPASIPREKQRRNKKRTKLSAEGINKSRLCTCFLKNIMSKELLYCILVVYMCNRCCTRIMYYS